jgi:hypothetical protein
VVHVAPDLGSCTRNICGCSAGPDFLFPLPGPQPATCGDRKTVINKGAGHGRHRVDRACRGDRQCGDPGQEITELDSGLHDRHRPDAYSAVRLPPAQWTAGPACAPLRRGQGTRRRLCRCARPPLAVRRCGSCPRLRAGCVGNWPGWVTGDCWKSSTRSRWPALCAPQRVNCW